MEHLEGFLDGLDVKAVLRFHAQCGTKDPAGVSKGTQNPSITDVVRGRIGGFLS